MSDRPAERVCDQCGIWVETTQPLYRMRVELAAEPWAPEDTGPPGDVREELEALVRRLEQMSEDEVEEATSQVHECFEYLLCPACRRSIRQALRTRRSLVDDCPDR
jgi:hypothetical protein